MTVIIFIIYCKQKTAYEMRISDWSSDVCSSDLDLLGHEDDVLVVREDHDRVGRDVLHHGEELGGGGVHRLAAGDDALHAERVEDPPYAAARGHRPHGAGDGGSEVLGNLGRAFGGGVHPPPDRKRVL